MMNLRIFHRNQYRKNPYNDPRLFVAILAAVVICLHLDNLIYIIISIALIKIEFERFNWEWFLSQVQIRILATFVMFLHLTILHVQSPPLHS